LQPHNREKTFQRSAKGAEVEVEGGSWQLAAGDGSGSSSSKQVKKEEEEEGSAPAQHTPGYIHTYTARDDARDTTTLTLQRCHTDPMHHYSADETTAHCTIDQPAAQPG